MPDAAKPAMPDEAPPASGGFSRWRWWKRWFGRRSEKAAARYLRKLGYRLLATNVSDRDGELDILALDGETFGHHSKFGEMALASAVSLLAAQRRVVVENYASVLARAPHGAPVLLVEPSSWSCIHGVERWRSDCSCGVIPGASHAWRRPLRSALMWLARELDARYEGVVDLPVSGEVDAPPAVLIRPDGHVAWAGTLTDAGLPRALETWFGPPGSA